MCQLGFPGCEFQIREALARAIGVEKAALFFEKVLCTTSLSLYVSKSNPNQFLDNFFAEADAKFFKSLGLNCIRIAVNYRHFEG